MAEHSLVKCWPRSRPGRLYLDLFQSYENWACKVGYVSGRLGCGPYRLSRLTIAEVLAHVN